jgi:hypothetical protein
MLRPDSHLHQLGIDVAEPILPQMLGHDSHTDRGDITVMGRNREECMLRCAARVGYTLDSCILNQMSFRRVAMLKFRLGELAAIRMPNGKHVGAKVELEVRRAFEGPRGKMSWPVLEERRRRRLGIWSMPGTDLLPLNWPDRLQIAAGDFDAADTHGLSQRDWDDLVMRFCTPETRNLDLVEWAAQS